MGAGPLADSKPNAKKSAPAQTGGLSFEIRQSGCDALNGLAEIAD